LANLGSRVAICRIWDGHGWLSGGREREEKKRKDKRGMLDREGGRREMEAMIIWKRNRTRPQPATRE